MLSPDSKQARKTSYDMDMVDRCSQHSLHLTTVNN